jgi:hypothetical protein
MYCRYFQLMDEKSANRIAPLFLNTAFKKEVDNLTPAQLQFFEHLARRVDLYIGNNFERDDFFGSVGGKWNILMWMTCILGVAQSRVETDCWLWTGSTKGGRPIVSGYDLKLFNSWIQFK